MKKFFKHQNKSNMMYQVYYGWDENNQKWFIDLQLPRAKKVKYIQWFDDKKSFDKTLSKIS